MIYFTGIFGSTRQTAGGKAPTDILELCSKRNYQGIPITKPSAKLPKIVQNGIKYFYCLNYWRKLYNMMNPGDVLIYQHPLFVSRTLPGVIDKFKKKGIKFIVLIHDLETLRGGIEGAVNANPEVNNMIEGKLLKKFDAVICHNEKMKAYLVSQGYDSQKVIPLQIFDYLSGCRLNHSDVLSEKPSISVAGNLLKTKSGYIYHIHDNGSNPNLDVHLFGVSFDTEANNPHLIYHGSFPADELPENLQGDFGLVWDGLSAETCEGHVGAYLKYNNPHKTSLYLSSGIPVVVWKQAAIADFVLKNKVGVVVDDLHDAEQVLAAVTPAAYKKMCANAAQMAERLRGGHYFYQALDEALKIVNA